MTRTIDDPDFGEIEVPERYIPPEEWEERVQAARETIEEADRLWPDGEVHECPECGEETFEGRSDLTVRVTRGPHVVSFRHLHGAECTSCGAATLEPYEALAVEDEAGLGFHPDYEASVSRIGSGTLGTYWPKDVERVLDLHPDKKAFIEVVDRDTVLVRFEEADEDESS